MYLVKSKLGDLENQSLEELRAVTREFLNLAEILYKNHKLTRAEYEELTFHKKEFLSNIK